jgi:hypothetical protein
MKHKKKKKEKKNSLFFYGCWRACSSKLLLAKKERGKYEPT